MIYFRLVVVKNRERTCVCKTKKKVYFVLLCRLY